MPSIFRRSNGIYYLVTRVNNRRVWASTGCRTKNEAMKFVLSRKERQKEPTLVSLSQFTTQVLASLKTNLAPGTVALYRSALGMFKNISGDLPLREYTPQMVESFKSTRMGEVSTVKVNIDFRTLRAAFNIAISWGLISENPFKKCKQVRVPQRRPTYLTHEEFSELMKVVPNEWFKDIIRFAVATMMRLGEIVNLRWDSVNLERRIILVENSGDFRTKTHKARAIPMDELIHLMLAKKARLGDHVFSFPDGRPLRVGYVSSNFKKFVRKAKLSEEVHFHTLRHTGATWLVQRDVPIYSVQQILGHSRVDMTQVYSHLEVDHLRKPMGMMTELLYDVTENTLQ